jgi:hypothetical protein
MGDRAPENAIQESAIKTDVPVETSPLGITEREAGAQTAPTAVDDPSKLRWPMFCNSIPCAHEEYKNPDWNDYVHGGIDLDSAACGITDVYAAYDGTVEYVGKASDAPKQEYPDLIGVLGDIIILDHPKHSEYGIRTLYGNLWEGSLKVKRRDTVSRGQVIANTGWPTETGYGGLEGGWHLHFEVLNDLGRSKDPLKYLGPLPVKENEQGNYVLAYGIAGAEVINIDPGKFYYNEVKFPQDEPTTGASCGPAADVEMLKNVQVGGRCTEKCPVGSDWTRIGLCKNMGLYQEAFIPKKCDDTYPNRDFFKCGGTSFICHQNPDWGWTWAPGVMGVLIDEENKEGKLYLGLKPENTGFRANEADKVKEKIVCSGIQPFNSSDAGNLPETELLYGDCRNGFLFDFSDIPDPAAKEYPEYYFTLGHGEDAEPAVFLVRLGRRGVASVYCSGNDNCGMGTQTLVRAMWQGDVGGMGGQCGTETLACTGTSDTDKYPKGVECGGQRYYCKQGAEGATGFSWTTD